LRWGPKKPVFRQKEKRGFVGKRALDLIRDRSPPNKTLCGATPSTGKGEGGGREGNAFSRYKKKKEKRKVVPSRIDQNIDVVLHE